MKFSHFKLYRFSSVSVVIRGSRACALISLPSVPLRIGYGSINTKTSSTSTSLNLLLIKFLHRKTSLFILEMHFEIECCEMSKVMMAEFPECSVSEMADALPAIRHHVRDHFICFFGDPIRVIFVTVPTNC